MGEVYKARDTRLDRTVAVKVLPPALAGDPQLRERFEREARAISAIEHPHICPLYDVGRLPAERAPAGHDEDVDFLVMQYLEGETLAARLERGPLAPDQVASRVWRGGGVIRSAVYWDVTADGQRFLLTEHVQVADAAAQRASVTILLGWRTKLQR